MGLGGGEGTLQGSRPWERIRTPDRAQLERVSWPALSRQRPECLENLRGLRESARLVLGEHGPIVGDDVEDPVGSSNQRALDAEILLDRGRQTGGPGFVVSNHAEFDADR